MSAGERSSAAAAAAANGTNGRIRRGSPSGPRICGSRRAPGGCAGGTRRTSTPRPRPHPRPRRRGRRPRRRRPVLARSDRRLDAGSATGRRQPRVRYSPRRRIRLPSGRRPRWFPPRSRRWTADRSACHRARLSRWTARRRRGRIPAAARGGTLRRPRGAARARAPRGTPRANHRPASSSSSLYVSPSRRAGRRC